MQWQAIAGATEARTGEAVTRTMAWSGGAPEVGNLDRDMLRAQCRVLADHTEPPDQRCFFALWEGFGWIYGGPSVVRIGSSHSIPPAFPRDVLDGRGCVFRTGTTYCSPAR